MKTNINIQTLVELISEYLTLKPNVRRATKFAEKEPETVEAFLTELESAISLFNTLKNTQQFPVKREILHNTTHLLSIMQEDLPSFQETFRTSETDNYELIKKSLSRMRDSEYLSAIWQISNPKTLLGNILILIYRTGMLITNPELERKSAQLSSVIEEMLAIQHIKGKEPKLFFCIRQWILDWKREGFSRQLSESI